MANIELDGVNKTIKVDSGDLTLDVPGDIILDAGGGDISLKDDGTDFGSLTNTSGNLIIQSGSTTARIYANDDYDSNTSALKICSDLDDNPNQLVLLGSGNIGINTSTPQQMLDVRGSAVIGIDQRSGNPGTTVGILTVRGHHVNSDSEYARLHFSNSKSAGGGTAPTASIRAGRSGDNYGTTLSFYNNPTGSLAETERMRITAGGVVKVAGITSTASLTVGPGIIQEKFYNQGSALTGTYNHDLNSDGMVLYAYNNASASFILNVRGDASTTLNSLMHIGQTSVFTAYTGSNNTCLLYTSPSPRD